MLKIFKMGACGVFRYQFASGESYVKSLLGDLNLPTHLYLCGNKRTASSLQENDFCTYSLVVRPNLDINSDPVEYNEPIHG